MMPEGYYRGTGPWWLTLLGWEGKWFYQDGTGLNRFGTAPGLPFIWYEEEGAIHIIYNSMWVPFEDVMVPDGGGWRGTIYLKGIKVGTFTLTR